MGRGRGRGHLPTGRSSESPAKTRKLMPPSVHGGQYSLSQEEVWEDTEHLWVAVEEKMKESSDSLAQPCSCQSWIHHLA